MKISIESNDERKATLEISDESDIYQVLEEFKGLLIAYGFHENSVKEGYFYMTDEYYGDTK